MPGSLEQSVAYHLPVIRHGLRKVKEPPPMSFEFAQDAAHPAKEDRSARPALLLVHEGLERVRRNHGLVLLLDLSNDVPTLLQRQDGPINFVSCQTQSLQL